MFSASAAGPLLDIAYVVSPGIAFLPQIWRDEILFSPLLSLLTIFSALLKIAHFQVAGRDYAYSLSLLYQSLFVVALHFYLIRHYRQPLKAVEARFLPAQLCARHGLIAYAVALTAGALALINVLYIASAGPLFGGLGCVMDVLISALQLVVYEGDDTKPRALFALWILGDTMRVWLMVVHFTSPPAQVVAVLLQIAMNACVLLK